MFITERIEGIPLKHMLASQPAQEVSCPWFLVQLKPNGLAMAQRNLQRQGFPLFCPMQPATRKRGARFVKTWQPLFPGYLFVSFRPETAPWRAINSTYGVARLVRFGGDAPAPVPHGLVQGLQMRCDKENRLLPPETLEPGDEVRILSGPFADFVTTVEKVAPDQRVWVLIDLMGRATKVAIAHHDIQRA